MDASGAIAESYAYDPYGRPRVMTAAGVDGNWLTEDTTATQDASAVGNPYLFTATATSPPPSAASSNPTPSAPSTA